MTNDPPALGAFFIGLGFVGIAWAFNSRAIKKQRGFKNKLRTLVSDGLEGPDQSMRLFLVGAFGLFAGSMMAISNIAPKATIAAFFAGYVTLLVLMLIALYRKYDLPRKMATKEKHLKSDL